MKGTLAIIYGGDPLPEELQVQISVAVAEAVAQIMVRYGYRSDSLLVQG